MESHPNRVDPEHVLSLRLQMDLPQFSLAASRMVHRDGFGGNWGENSPIAKYRERMLGLSRVVSKREKNRGENSENKWENV